MTLPKYSQPKGAAYDALPLTPPFFIRDQTAHIFPLRANMHVLQTFVDGYANIIPPEIGRFRVCSPYVQLMVLDYGSLSAKASNLGRLTQYETMFTVAVAWYRVVNGQWVFKDWAWLTPFILVDSELSFSLGRTEQGWHKGFAQWLPTTSSAWMQDPGSPIPVATVGSTVFENLYRGERQRLRPFLEVLRRPPASPLGILADAKAPFAPWEAMRNAASAMQRFSRDYFGVLDGIGIMPWHLVTSQQNYMRMAMRAAASLGPGKPDISFNTLNLKQFRDVGSASDYCYQALTNGKLRVASLKAGGPLSDTSVFSGDTTGGYMLRLHRWPSLPIIETLGLEVARQWRGDGVDIAEIEPVLPFWYTVDMVYDQSENVAWRAADRIWRDRNGRAYPPRDGAESPLEGQYNTMLGAYTRELPGPFAFSSVARVLPLLAKKSAVQRFLDSHYNAAMNIDTPSPLGWRFDVWGPPSPCDEDMYVYLVATTYESVTSRNHNVGKWAEEDSTFLVPVLLRERVGAEWQLRSAGVIPIFSYADNVTAAVTMSETGGIPTAKASFVHPPSSWMTRDSKTQKLVEISTEVMPALNLGQGARREIILEIFGGDGAANGSEPWSSLLAREAERKSRTARESPERLDESLSLCKEVVGGGIPFHVFTLKQFRDSFAPDRACYQSIVKIPCTIEKLRDLREEEQPMRIRIHEYPSQPIVELLGLVATRAKEQEGGVVYDARPVRPFSFKMDHTLGLGENVWVRCGTESWTASGGAGSATSEALAAIDPQMIIEAMLSREPSDS